MFTFREASEMRTYCLLLIFLGVFVLLMASCSTEESISGSSYYGGPVVRFPDSTLEAAVRSYIGKPEGPIYVSDIDKITSFSCTSGALDPGIADLTGIQYMTALEELNLYMNHRIYDLSPLSGLSELRQLNLGCCSRPGEFESLEPLSHLVNLTGLTLCARGIRDISDLANLAELEALDLGVNEITDLSALSPLVKLRSLILDDNEISDLTPLANLSELTYLRAGFNQISDVSPLAELTNLRKLDLGANDRACPAAADGAQGDRPPQATPNLDDGEYANLIEDIGPLAGLTELEELILNENLITDLSPLENLTNLTEIWFDRNNIHDIGPLSGLTELKHVWLGYNQITTILPLIENPGINEGDLVTLLEEPLDSVSIHVYIPELQARGVEVWF